MTASIALLFFRIGTKLHRSVFASSTNTAVGPELMRVSAQSSNEITIKYSGSAAASVYTTNSS